MDTYTDVSYEIAEKLTRRYSTSFSMSSRLFDPQIRKHIYAVYGMVRIADEVVDTFRGDDAKKRLHYYWEEVNRSIEKQYSTNPIIHAFAHTAREYSIHEQLIDPFFESMETDLHKKTFSEDEYKDYIHGSAEVIGLMCLKIFIDGDMIAYNDLQQGAASLGSAYQKVNFLRDFADDYSQLGRVYFPGVNYDSFSENDKGEIIADIIQDFRSAELCIGQLPKNSRKAVNMSYVYYQSLLDKIEQTPISTIKQERIRVSDWKKLYLLITTQVNR